MNARTARLPVRCAGPTVARYGCWWSTMRSLFPDEPVTVSGDEMRLGQVLANLLANARTHTPSGSTVVIGLSGDDAEVRLRVSDDGPGIPADLMPHGFTVLLHRCVVSPDRGGCRREDGRWSVQAHFHSPQLMLTESNSY